MFAGIDVASERHVLARLDGTGQPLGRPIGIDEDAGGYRMLLEAAGFDGLNATAKSGRDDINHVVIAEVRQEGVRAGTREIQTRLARRKETTAKKESQTHAIAVAA